MIVEPETIDNIFFYRNFVDWAYEFEAERTMWDEMASISEE